MDSQSFDVLEVMVEDGRGSNTNSHYIPNVLTDIPRMKHNIELI